MADDAVTGDINHQLVFITGESGTGKSASLRNIRDQPDWWLLNCEAGKRLPFQNKFKDFRIENPYEVWEGFDAAITRPDVKGIVIDTATFMMDMFESQFIYQSTNTQSAWGDYAQFWKKLLQEKVVAFGRPVIILAHTRRELDEANGRWAVQVPVKGSLKNNGLESYFSTVVSTKQVPMKDLREYVKEGSTALLNVTEDDELLGFKHVFQTRLTKNTVGERIRAPMGLFTREQTFMDNDAQLLLDHLHRFYGA